MQNHNQAPYPKQDKYRITASQWRLFFLVLVLGAAGLLFFFLNKNNLADSAALYVGLPVLIALGLTLTPKTQSVATASLKTITIALLLSAPIFQEGYLCILLVSPIFYSIGVGVGLAIDHYYEKKNSKLKTAMIVTAFCAMSLEGTMDITSFDRFNEVSASKIVQGSLEQVTQQLAQTPHFKKERPFFLKLFLLPDRTEGSGLEIGDQRSIHFTYHKWVFFNAHKGETIFEVTENNNNHYKFAVKKDTSYLSNYMKWLTSEVKLEAISPTETKVTWTLTYERKLDPYWYFGPMQSYAASKTAETLIDNLATPIGG